MLELVVRVVIVRCLLVVDELCFLGFARCRFVICVACCCLLGVGLVVVGGVAGWLVGCWCDWFVDWF